MTTTAMISVKIEGPVGLDDPRELLEELEGETGFGWRVDRAEPEGTLDPVTALVTAVVTSVVTAVVQAAVERAIDKWKGRRLDPPNVTIVIVQPPAGTESVPDQVPPQELEAPGDPDADPERG
ncbi:hypothetical protein ACWD4G_21895 [Streptomyces sp. NPDC002643]